MIVVKIFGGLGNQLFQYAFGRRLALERNTELYFDLSTYNQSFDSSFTKRDFEMDVFDINGKIADAKILSHFSQSKFNKLLNEFIIRSPFVKSANYLREPHFHFYDNALRVSNKVYVNGYWQSEKYFSSIRNQLLTELIPTSELSTESQLIYDDIKNHNAVSLHIRRGDYINETNQSIYHVCSLDYYSKAVDYICSKVAQPKFYIFSDDVEWVKSNLNINQQIHYLEHNKGKNSYQDLILMSKCNHNIIANSSFSWWGAWLNQHENKIVISPEKWFKSNSKKTQDLIPSKWIQL
jgi:hypothetical protein